ncbi:MAG: hypothetical protein ACLSGS_03305 [Adlercreutzia sp.]
MDAVEGDPLATKIASRAEARRAASVAQLLSEPVDQTWTMTTAYDARATIGRLRSKPAAPSTSAGRSQERTSGNLPLTASLMLALRALPFRRFGASWMQRPSASRTVNRKHRRLMATLSERIKTYLLAGIGAMA